MSEQKSTPRKVVRFDFAGLLGADPLALCVRDHVQAVRDLWSADPHEAVANWRDTERRLGERLRRRIGG